MQQGAADYRDLVRKAMARGDGPQLKAVQRVTARWFPLLRRSIAVSQGNTRRKQYARGAHIWGGPILLLNPSQLAVITMHETLGRVMDEPGGVPLVKLSYGIGKAVIAEASLKILRKTQREQLDELDKRIKRRTPRNVTWWTNKTLADPIWNRRVCAHLGVHLLWHLIAVADCSREGEDFRVSFHHHTRRIKGKTPAFIVPDDQLLDIIDEGHRVRQNLRPRMLPMIVEPLAWETDDEGRIRTEGGYAVIRRAIVSKITPSQRAALASSDMTQMCQGLNAINRTPWQINLWILSVIESLWERGGNVCGIPSAEQVPMPPRAPDGSSDEIINKAKAERCRIHDRNIELSALRKVFLTKLDVAKKMASRSAFWFTHILCFRGRFYPEQHPLNHQDDDISRSMLNLSECRSPGERGLRWIKVHAANCYGVDKVDFDARVAWTEAHMPEITDAAANPLSSEWWHQADSPLQFLAACRALVDENAAGRIPIQVDGSCNGLQHYAALGRDSRGAAAVNLIPSDTPNDLYSDVADEVARSVAAHASGEVRGSLKYTHKRKTLVRSYRTISKRLDGRVDRKITKPNVMTTSYNATKAGRRKQNRDALVELKIVPEDRPRELLETKLYLTDQISDAVSVVCSKSREIMDWLMLCARAIARGEGKDGGRTVEWTSPLGFRVSQPYFRWNTVRVSTMLGTITLQVDEEDVPVHVRDQVQGVAPNVIHTFDAAHAIKTAIVSVASDEGIQPAFVHDCFWCHAANMDRFGQIIREQFVELHEEPLLEILHADFQAQASIDLPGPPPRGDMDIRDVLNAPYAFA